jgi:hypothetical protein
MLRKATICGQGTSGWRLVRSPETRAAASPRGWINLQFCYAPRRVECAEHGVVVEHIPWNDGKRMAFRRQTENR